MSASTTTGRSSPGPKTGVASKARKGAGAAPPASAGGAEIDALLTASLEENARLLALAERHHAALRRADGVAAAACAEEQDACLRRIAELDQRRVALVQAFQASRAHAAGGPGGGPLTITDLTSAVPEPDRTRLREKAATLRDLMARIRAEYQTIQLATRSLLAHMEGLMRQIGRQLSPSGTYGRRGYVENAGSACAIDLTR